MFEYIPEQIIIDEAVQDETLTREICERFSHIPQIPVKDYAWHREEKDYDPARNPLTKGKKTLHLKNFKGMAIKSCPGLTEEAVCCNYFTIDIIENCPFECTYCILQAFLNKPVITIHANLEDILKQIKQRVAAEPQKIFRVGTGEHSDSLALDTVLDINSHIIRFFSQLPNAILELKTKSNHIEHLLDIPHGGKTVIAWSVNPEYIVENEEFKTARLHDRLDAAEKASQAGYKIAFHFDPIIHYPDWETGYTGLVELLFEKVSPQQVAWISLGTLRYIPKLKAIVEERFPNSRIFLSEFVPAPDGKMRYLKKIRQQMFWTIQHKIGQLAPEVPCYLCMEKEMVWKNAMPVHPKSNREVEDLILRNM